MKRKLLSLFLVACMVLPMIPIMVFPAVATDAQSGGNYTTSFSYDATSANFPTLTFDMTTQHYTNANHVAKLKKGDYDFSYLPEGSAAGTITYKGNWEMGQKSVTTTGAGTQDASSVIGSDFTAFNTLFRSSTQTVMAVNDGSVSVNGCSYWLTNSSATTQDILLADMNFTRNTTAGTRTPSSYTATSAIRYVCEYSGTVNITATIAAFAGANGSDLVVLYDGTEVARIENGVATAASKTDLPVVKGNAIEFVHLADASHTYLEADYNNYARRGARGVECTVEYTKRELTTSARLEISDAYAVNLYMDAVLNDMASCGFEINGKQVPATLQADGRYKIVAQDNIKVYELTGTLSSNRLYTKDPATNMVSGVEITYKPYATTTDGITVEGEEKTLCTRDLLYAYIDGDYDDTTKALAQAICDLADASRPKFEAGYQMSHYFTKTHLKGQSGPYTSYLSGDDKTNRDNDSNYTKNGVLLASLQYYTYVNAGMSEAEALAKVGNSGASNALIPLTNDNLTDFEGYGIADITAGVRYGYTSDVNAYAYKIVGANVNLGDKISMVFLANGNGENSMYDLKNYSIKVMNGSQEVVVSNSGFKATEVDGVAYMGIIVDVPISLYDTDLTVTIVDASGNDASASLTYSVSAWCVRSFVFAQCANESTDQYPLQGVYLLGKAAKAYAAAH